MNQDWFRKLVAAEKQDSSFRNFLRSVLSFLSIFYGASVSLRNWLYDKNILKSVKVSRPVISIGNITTGGTGKTPLVIWMARYLDSQQINSAILTRGYKAGKTKVTDEPAILAKTCKKARVIVNPNRVVGARKAISEFDCKALIMDDGFQHRRLSRDLDIVAIDATCPFGYGKLLPGGLLREKVEQLKRADAVVITRYDQGAAPQVEKLEQKIMDINPSLILAKANHTPLRAVLFRGETIELGEVKEKKVFAFCGIGNPNAFLNMLGEIGLDVVGSRVYNDHHTYTSDDMTDIYEEARYLGAEIILSTQKDWVKTALLSMEKKDILFAYLAIELTFVGGEDKLKAQIDKTVSDNLTPTG